MATLKVMSIISYVITAIALLCLVAFNNDYEYVSAVGWGIILAFWSIGYTVTVHVQANRIK